MSINKKTSRILCSVLEVYERTDHRDDFNVDFEGEEFFNPFHNQSPLRWPCIVERVVHDHEESELNMKLMIPEYNGSMKGEKSWLPNYCREYFCIERAGQS